MRLWGLCTLCTFLQHKFSQNPTLMFLSFFFSHVRLLQGDEGPVGPPGVPGLEVSVAGQEEVGLHGAEPVGTGRATFD